MSKPFTFGHPVSSPSFTGGGWADFAADDFGPLPVFGCLVDFHAKEREAMQAGLVELTEILSWARPHGSPAELDFCKSFLLPAIRAAGLSPEIDGFGNIWARVPAPSDYAGPCVLWSCHVDTVHAKGGRQSVRYQGDGRTLELVKAKPGRCLGADDGAGVFLLLEMLRAGIVGGYVFHRGEEKGRLGSEHVSAKEPERLQGYDACVAFDRRDYADLITHQMGTRCASEAFAASFSAAINGAGRGLKYRADDGGSYTDSYSYAGQISECCNVSVGYDSEHGPRETLDALHVWRLLEALLSADFSGVVCERDASTFDDWGSWVGYLGGSYSGSGWGADGGGSRTGAAAWKGSSYAGQDKETERLTDLVCRYPAAVVDLLMSYGLGVDELLDSLTPSELSQALAMGSH